MDSYIKLNNGRFVIMSFCPLCGKELAEGEKCTCSNKTEAVNFETEFVDVWEHVKMSFTNPIGAAKKYFNKGNMISTAILLAVLLIMSVLASFLSYAWYGRYDFLKAGYVLKSIFFPVIYMVVMCIATVITAFVADIILKREFKLDKVVAICGAVAVPLMVSVLAGLVNIYINVSVFRFIFNTIATLARFVALIQGLACLDEMVDDKKKLFLALIVSVALLCLFSYLISLPLSGYTGFVHLTF